MKYLALAASCILALATQLAVADEKPPLPKVKHMIDTHIHLYDTTREKGVPWPPSDDKVLYKPHLPAEFKKVSQPTGLTGVVIVEASDRLEDNRWVLDLVKGDDYFVALVGNIDPYRKDFEEQLVRLKKDPRFVGVRARNGEEAKPIVYTDAKVLESFRALAKHGLSLDILANGGGVEAVKQVDRLAREIPELRIIVDHVLGYNIDGKAADPEWVAAVEKLGKNKNVWCKVSGLYQRSVPQPSPRSIDHYRSVLDVLWKNLGKQRLIYGSNWPCTKNSGDYDSFVRLVNQYFSEKGEDASERYFWKNAAAAYKLKIGKQEQKRKKGTLSKAKEARIKADLTAFGVALNLYRVDAGRFPTTEQGLKALWEKPTVGRVPRNWTQYIKKEQLDPWGNPYGYRYPPKENKGKPDIFSSGSDGVAGTADDIGNWP